MAVLSLGCMIRWLVVHGSFQPLLHDSVVGGAWQFSASVLGASLLRGIRGVQPHVSSNKQVCNALNVRGCTRDTLAKAACLSVPDRDR